MSGLANSSSSLAMKAVLHKNTNCSYSSCEDLLTSTISYTINNNLPHLINLAML